MNYLLYLIHRLSGGCNVASITLFYTVSCNVTSLKDRETQYTTANWVCLVPKCDGLYTRQHPHNVGRPHARRGESTVRELSPGRAPCIQIHRHSCLHHLAHRRKRTR